MTLLQRGTIMLIIAGIIGLAGAPVLAIVFACIGYLLLDIVLISGLWRMIFRRKRE